MSGTWTRIEMPVYAMRIPEVVAAVESEAMDDAHVHNGVQSLADETRWGEFESLEPVLKRLRIPYDVRREADHESAETLVCYRPGDGRSMSARTQACANGDPVVTVATLRDIAKRVKTAGGLEKAVKRLIEDNSVVPLTEMLDPPPRLARRMTLPDPTTLSDYRVKLSAMAHVEGEVRVRAANATEAERVAKEQIGDLPWDYKGVDGDINVSAVTAI